MEDSVLSKELIEAFRPIVEMNNVRFRQVKTMLAGFIATQERDLNYMDEYMDVLFDFMDPESDTKMLMRQYYATALSFKIVLPLGKCCYFIAGNRASLPPALCFPIFSSDFSRRWMMVAQISDYQ